MFALIAVTIYCVFSLYMGIRMLLLARRTRQLPELMIGLALVSGGMLGYPGSIAAGVLVAAAQVGPATIAHVIGQSGMALAAFFMLLSWRQIFSEGGTPGRVLVVGWTLFVASTLFGVIKISDPGSSAHFTTTTLRLLLVAQGGCYAILGWASYRHSRMLKKRCAIGLADPRIANRMFVWALANASIVISYVYALVAGFLMQFKLPSYYDPSIVAGLGLTSAICVWLSFFPPKAYLERIGIPSTGEVA